MCKPLEPGLFQSQESFDFPHCLSLEKLEHPLKSTFYYTDSTIASL